mmetsp:Transcript_20446/g.40484  ORF Transcript_20446/g.40484 Transcript_20446/m.40484 type:complete len:214 (+) Transcript_20446:274-915(+)
MPRHLLRTIQCPRPPFIRFGPVEVVDPAFCPRGQYASINIAAVDQNAKSTAWQLFFVPGPQVRHAPLIPRPSVIDGKKRITRRNIKSCGKLSQVGVDVESRHSTAAVVILSRSQVVHQHGPGKLVRRCRRSRVGQMSVLGGEGIIFAHASVVQIINKESTNLVKHLGNVVVASSVVNVAAICQSFASTDLIYFVVHFARDLIVPHHVVCNVVH